MTLNKIYRVIALKGFAFDTQHSKLYTHPAGALNRFLLHYIKLYTLFVGYRIFISLLLPSVGYTARAGGHLHSGNCRLMKR